MSDTNNFNGLDKAAILFQIFGESLALTMFQDLQEPDLLRIRVRAKELQNIPVEIKQTILEEYYFKMMSQKYHNLGSKENKLFNFLINLNDEQIFYLINTESPKVIALALDQLDEKRKVKLLNRFGSDVKHNIIMELGNLNTIPLEAVVNVAQELKKKTSFIPGPKEFSRGGGKSIASILSQMAPDAASQYLDNIAADDPELYAQVKKYFLSFDDLVSMPAHLMNTFWRNPEIDVDVLAKALKGSDEGLVNDIIKCLPKRKQQMFTIYEQPLSKKEIDKSQLSFVQLAKTMHENKEINLDDILNSEDDLVE